MLTSTVMNVCFLLFGLIVLILLRIVVSALRDIYQRLGYIADRLK